MNEFRQFLRSQSLTQHEFAQLLGHSRRTGQYWANGALSAAAETMAMLLAKRPELLDVVREIAAERSAAQVAAKSAAKKGKK